MPLFCTESNHLAESHPPPLQLMPRAVPRRSSSLMYFGILAALFGGTYVMSQTPATPNLTNPATVDDFNAIKALSAAQADALDAQARLIASQKAYAKAQAADDPATAQLTAATQAAGIAAQKKALSDSQAAILKNNFTVPDSGYTGDIKAGDKAGSFEASLLAARALNLAADHIATKIHTKVSEGSSIILYGGSDLPDFQSLIAYQTQIQIIEKALADALNKMDGPQTEANRLLGAKREFVTPAMIGAGLDAANKLLGFFRTDYSIQGVAVTADDLLLIDALAGALSEEKVNVSLPALYNAPALLGDSPIVSQLSSLATERMALQQKVDLAAKGVDALTTAAGKETDAGKKKQMVDAAANLKTASDQGKVGVALYDGFITKLTTPDDKAKVPLAAIIQQEAVRSALKGGANLMTAKISSAGGTYYTRKNLWSFFGAMPFFTMGGVVVDYSLFNGKTGVVLSAGAVPVDGGFFKVGELPQLLSDEPVKIARRRHSQ